MELEIEVKLLEKAEAFAKRRGLTEKEEYNKYVEKLFKEYKNEEREMRIERRNREKEDKERQAKIEQEDKDRQAKIDLEKTKLDLEKTKLANDLELEKAKLANELELAKINSNKQETTNDQTQKNKRKQYKSVVPVYDENTENIYKFLKVFETQCTLQNIPEEDWPGYLVQSLKDKSREAVSLLTKEEMKSYTTIKQHLLKYFVKTPDFYRQQFHKYTLKDTTKPTAFVADVKNFLVTWLELSEINLNDPIAILDMMVVDKVLDMSSDELFTHIKEKNIRTTKQLVDVITEFKDSHPNSMMCKTVEEKSFNVIHRHKSYSPPHMRNRYGEQNDNRNRYQNRQNNGFNNYSDQTSRNDIFQNNRQPIVCYNCNGENHIARNCSVQKQQSQSNDFYSQQQNVNNNNRGRNQVVKANANQQGQNAYKQNCSVIDQNVPRTSQSLNTVINNDGHLLFFPAVVNNIETVTLRDSGCSTLVVSKDLVLPEQYIDETEIVRLGNGQTETCKKAIINIDTPWITGEAKCVVMKDLIAPLITGNIDGIVPDNSIEIVKKWCSQRKEPKIMPKILKGNRITDVTLESLELEKLDANNKLIIENKMKKDINEDKEARFYYDKENHTIQKVNIDNKQGRTNVIDFRQPELRKRIEEKMYTSKHDCRHDTHREFKCKTKQKVHRNLIYIV